MVGERLMRAVVGVSVGEVVVVVVVVVGGSGGGEEGEDLRK